MNEKKHTDLNVPKFDVIVLGARTEEKNYLDTEIAGVADPEETLKLRARLKTEADGFTVGAAEKSARTKGIQGYALRSKTPHVDGKPNFISVGVVHCAEMGNVSSSINTAFYMARYRPSLMIFSGIAGSMNSSWFRIGDVIIPSKVKTRYFQKLKTFEEDYELLPEKDKIERLAHIKGQLHPATETVDIKGGGAEILNNFNADKLTPLLKSEPIPADWVARHPEIATRPVIASAHEETFCWDKVLSNAAYVKYLRGELGNAASAVDMESYGFLRTIEKLRNAEGQSGTDGIVVRSISDYAEYKDLSDDAAPSWRALAMRNMAIATRYIIQYVFDLVY